VREGEEKKREGWLGWAAKKKKRERKRKRRWAGPKENKREEKNCIQMHLNLNPNGIQTIKQCNTA
jgi:hypothetical protein